MSEEYELGYQQDPFNCKPTHGAERSILPSPGNVSDKKTTLEENINKYRKSIGLKPIEIAR